jgi:hypothetical protein
MPDLSDELQKLVGLIPNLHRRLQATSKAAKRQANLLSPESSKYHEGSRNTQDFQDDSTYEQDFDLERLFADL